MWLARFPSIVCLNMDHPNGVHLCEFTCTQPSADRYVLQMTELFGKMLWAIAKTVECNHKA